MAFVNEYIPKEDYEKYDIKAIDFKTPGMMIGRRDWTIDRARNIYLRQTSDGYREDPISANWTWWTFYWKGELLWFKKIALGVTKEAGLMRAHPRITDFTIPAHLETHKEEIKKDLREAFNAYGGGGVFSKGTDFVYDLVFDD